MALCCNYTLLPSLHLESFKERLVFVFIYFLVAVTYRFVINVLLMYNRLKNDWLTQWLIGWMNEWISEWRCITWPQRKKKVFNISHALCQKCPNNKTVGVVTKWHLFPLGEPGSIFSQRKWYLNFNMWKDGKRNGIPDKSHGHHIFIVQWLSS